VTGAAPSAVSARPRLVLASASPRRSALLARLGVTPAVHPADVDEAVRSGEAPAELVVRLARTKATTVARAVTDGGDPVADVVVLAADTEVVLDGQVLGKPEDRSDAGAMLRRLAGRSHQVTTGLAVVRGDAVEVDRVTTVVTFRPLTHAEVAWYLATGEPAGKAGGYALQGAGAALVERIEGSDTNVIGLPLAETVALLRRVGLDLLAP
jgi:septum formation protein